MTVFAPTGNATGTIANPEVHLQCMKPIGDEPDYDMAYPSAGSALVARTSRHLLSGTVAFTLLMAVLAV